MVCKLQSCKHIIYPSIYEHVSYFHLIRDRIRYSRTERESKEMLDLLVEKTRNYDSIVVQTFSGNGLSFWCHMLKYMKSPKVLFQ